MHTAIREFDWSRTPMGPMAEWALSLRANVVTLLDNMFPSILAWGSHLTVCAYNDAYRPLLGDKPEALGRPFLEVWSEADGIIGPLLDRALQGEACFYEKAPFTLMRTGLPERAYFDYCFSPVRDEDGAVKGILNTAVETTSWVQSTEALRESEKRLSFVMENSEDNLFLQDLDLRYVWVSKAVYPFTREDYLGRTDMEFEGPREELEYLTRIKRQVIETGQAAVEELSLRPKGEPRDFLATFKPWWDETGRVIGVVGYVRDITRQKQAEQASLRDKALFQSTFENAAVGIAHFSPDGRILRVNQRFCDITGYRGDELCEMSFQEITHPEDLGKDLELTGRLFQGEIHDYDLEKRYIKKDRSLVWVRLSASIINEEMGVGVIEDITERKEAEAKLVKAHAELERRVEDRTRALKVSEMKARKEAARRRRFADRLVDILESDRRQMATMLHEDVGQMIAGTKMEVENVFRELMDENPELARRLQHSTTRLQDTIAQVRQVSHQLHPASLAVLGLVPSLRSLREEIATGACRVHFFFSGVPDSLSPDLSLAVFRVAQEAVANAFQHSGCSEIHLSLTARDNALHLTVEDDGCGFTTYESLFKDPGRGSLGLVIMRERSINSGGTFHVESSPGEGTTVVADFPLNDDPRSTEVTS